VAGWEPPRADTMTTSEQTLQPPFAEPPGSVALARRKRWPYVTGAILGVVLIFVIVSFRINLNYFAVIPGQAQAVGPLLSVPADLAHPIKGQLLLTDVGVGDVTLGNWLYYKLDSNAVLYPKSDFIEPGTDEAQYDQQGVVEMDESQLSAAAVALRQLGYSVRYYDAGVLVWATLPGSAAFTQLSIGDVITSVDNIPTPNVPALTSALKDRPAGQRITVQVGTIDQPKKDHAVSLTLSVLKDNGQVVKQDGKPLIGIGLLSPFTQPGWDFPFKVSVNLNNIGGPSAGLAFTLGIIDSLTGGNLTGGRTISATGTICSDGTVGQVGGVPQKTIAVENAHATVFLVPQAEVSQAKDKATSSLRVFGVNTLQQALQDLKSLGGNLGAALKGPPAGPGGHSLPSNSSVPFPSVSTDGQAYPSVSSGGSACGL
jgi:PDZ domain-containing protein